MLQLCCWKLNTSFATALLIQYICFSGYDFGYLLKLLTDQNLPQEESDFFELLRIYFPTVYDVKVSNLVHKNTTLFIVSLLCNLIDILSNLYILKTCWQPKTVWRNFSTSHAGPVNYCHK
jgi:hypothetical protein